MQFPPTPGSEYEDETEDEEDVEEKKEEPVKTLVSETLPETIEEDIVKDPITLPVQVNRGRLASLKDDSFSVCDNIYIFTTCLHSLLL